MIGTFSAAMTGLLTWNMLLNLKKRRRLQDFTIDQALCPKEALDELTIAIPARNEAENLKELLAQIFSQDLQVRKVIVLDDNSEDDTAKLLATFQEKYPERLEHIQGASLPNEWRGKVWALQQLLDQLHSPWVLFLDADVRFERSDALTRLWQVRQKLGPAFISVFPRPRVKRSAALLVDQVYTHLFYFLPAQHEKWTSSSAVAASGQLMLLPVSELRDLGGFHSIKNSTHDGLKLARLFKGAGKKSFFIDGFHFVTCAFYKNFSEAFQGFSRNSFEATNSLIVTGMIAFILFWVFVLPFVVFPFLLANPLWLLSFFILLYGQYRLAREFELGLSHIPLTPLKATASIGVHLWGAIRTKAGIVSHWRGRAV